MSLSQKEGSYVLQTNHEIKKVVHRSLSAKMIVKRMLFILVGALLMAVGLEFFLSLMRLLTVEL